MSVFEPTVQSDCTQVDRDIALILDRTGSMAFHVDWTGDANGQSWSGLEDWVDDQLDDLADAGGHWEYYYNKRGKRRRRWIWDDMDIRDEYYEMLDYKNELATDTYPNLETDYNNYGKKINYVGI